MSLILDEQAFWYYFHTGSRRWSCTLQLSIISFFTFILSGVWRWSNNEIILSRVCEDWRSSTDALDWTCGSFLLTGIVLIVHFNVVKVVCSIFTARSLPSQERLEQG